MQKMIGRAGRTFRILGTKGCGMKANKGYAMVLIAALMWGSIGVFIKALTALGLSSASIAALRLLVGAAILVPVLMFMGTRARHVPDGEPSGPWALFRATPRSLFFCALVGVIGLASANLLYYLSMGEVGMSTASVLLYTMPVFGVVLGRVLYGEPMSANKVLAVALNITGCVLAVTNGSFSDMAFSAFGVGAGVLAGVFGRLARRVQQGCHGAHAPAGGDVLRVRLRRCVHGGDWLPLE